MLQKFALGLAILISMTTSGWADQPKLVRLAVVDCSGSMQNGRLSIVKDELQKILKQLPPTADYPFVLITFDDSAQPATTFTDETTASAAVDGISIGGGTCIAAGLESAVNEVNKLATASHIWVLFYSDGEDPSLDAILEQEARLNAIFAQRQQSGLSQSVIFKSWGNANGILKQRFQDQKHAVVTDAGDANLVTVKMDPKIVVSSVNWSTKKLGLLEIQISPEVVLDGNSTTNWAPLRFKCDFAGAEGDLEFEVRPGGTPRTLNLSIPVPQSPADSEIKVPFKVSAPASLATDSAMLVPLLTNTTVEAVATIPTTKITRIYHVIYEVGPGTWTEPLSNRAKFPVKLRFEVESSADSPEDDTTTFQIVPKNGTVLLEGSPQFKIPGTGNHLVELMFENAAVQLANDPFEPTFSIAATVTAINVSDNVTLNPSEVEMSLDDIPAPPPIVTNVRGRAISAQSLRWIDLVTGTAAIEASFEFDVDGPIPPNTEIAVVVPPGVTEIKFFPNSLHPGRQTVKATITGRISAIPKPTSFALIVIPPPPRGAVRFSAGQPIRFTVQPLKPIQIVAQHGKRVQTQLAATIPDNSRQTALAITPAFLNSSGVSTSGIRVSVRSDTESMKITSNDLLRMGAPQYVGIEAASNQKTAFFRDTIIQGSFELSPYPQSPAVVGSRYPVQVTVVAPFKRILFYLATSVSAVLAIALLGWVWHKFRNVDN